MSNMLLIDCCLNSGLELNLNESSDRGLTKFRGKFQEANKENKNRRVYTYEVLDENVKKLNECIKARGLVGELDHPEDSIIHFEKASHVITKLWWEGNVMMGEGEILNTPHGKILKVDVVADPSTYAAFQRKVVGTRESQEHIPEENYKNPVKNEASCIHKVNKEALIACLGGIVKEQTGNILTRLG